MKLRRREKLALWALVTLALCCGCVHTEKHQLDATSAQHDLSSSTEHLRIDSAEQAQLLQHTFTTTGPGQEVERWFAPDGGVAHEIDRSWGPATAETILKADTAAEQHLELDAGTAAAHDGATTVKTKDDTDTHPSMSCASAGMLWALVAIGVVVVGLKLLASRAS